MIRVLMMLLVISTIWGCSSDAWRAGAQESAKNECFKAPIGEQQRCLDRLKEGQR
jgi:hypothetical protein